MKENKKTMTRKEQLQEEEEELFFKKMFAAFDEEDAPKYEALNEQLKNDPAYQTTPEQDKAMRAFIAREIRKRDKELARRSRESVRQSQNPRVVRFMPLLSRAAVIIVILGFLTATAYASIPDFRVMALNLLLRTSDEATRLAITDRWERTDRRDTFDDSEIILLGYCFPGVPEGFIKEDELSAAQKSWVRYSNGQGKTIKYQVYVGVERDVALDTEDADSKPILVHEHEGSLTKKGDTINVSWYDEANKTYFIIIANGLDAQFVFNLAYEVTPAE